MKTWLKKGERGFTLIELLAVMAILAVLAAMVAPAVSGTKEASVDAKVLSDATQVRTATTDYFKDQTGSEIRTPHSIITATLVTSTTTGTTAVPGTLDTVGSGTNPLVTGVKQVVSDRWPELYLTAGTSVPSVSRTGGFSTSAVYSTIFNTVADPVVRDVVLIGSDGKTITGTSLVSKFTAIDLEVLKSQNYLATIPTAPGTPARRAQRASITSYGCSRRRAA